MNIIRVMICIVVIAISAGCKEKKGRKQLPLTRVEVATATIDSLFTQVNIPSSVKALRYATIQPRAEGFLNSINFKGGMPVKKGDLLFTVDPSTFTTTLYAAKAELESALASEVLAERNYERAEPLARIDAISESDLDQYRATYKAALAATKSAEENLRSAQLEIGYTKIYAPISGIASMSTASVGDYIGISTLQSSLATISQTDTVSVELPITTAKYLRYSTSESFDNKDLLSQITLTLPDSSTYEYLGSYYYTLKNTPTASSTVVIVVNFPNPSLRLKEGMFTRIRANIGDKRACTVVPRQAVSQLQGVNSVWVIKEDSVAQWRKVDLGECRDSLWVVESGLAAGEVVVVSGGAKLRNGVKVSATAAK